MLTITVTQVHIRQANNDRARAPSGCRFHCPIEYALAEQVGQQQQQAPMAVHRVYATYTSIDGPGFHYKTPPIVQHWMRTWDLFEPVAPGQFTFTEEVIY